MIDQLNPDAVNNASAFALRVVFFVALVLIAAAFDRARSRGR